MKYGLFPSTEAEVTPAGLLRGNKSVDAEFLAKIVSAFYADGIFLNENGGGFHTSVQNNMTVATTGGVAHAHGYFCWEDETVPHTFPVSAAQKTYAHVIRFDLNEGEVTAVWKTVTGTPTVTRGETVCELMTCTVTVPAGATAVRDSMIRDTRTDNTLCGVVAGAFSDFSTELWKKQLDTHLAELSNLENLDMTVAEELQLRKLNADLSNLSQTLNENARGMLSSSHTHSANQITAGTLSPEVRASDGTGDGYTLRNIAFSERIPTDAAEIPTGGILCVLE